MDKSIRKCSYSKCIHEDKTIPQGEEVLKGSRYMHRDCAEIQENISKVKEVYYEQISKTVVMKNLMATIYNIVFTKKVDSAYLLFALKTAISKNISIKSPYSLHYIIDYKQIKDEWTSRQVKKKIKIASEEDREETQNPLLSQKFVSSSKSSGFGNILGR